jgi:hypothetical protein
MTTLLEGPWNEVREHLNGLSLPPEMHVQINVEETTGTVQEEHDSYADLEQKYANHPRRYGILQVPIPGLTTIDQVNELRD